MISIDDEVLCDRCLKVIRDCGFRSEGETLCPECARELNIEYLDADELKEREER